MSRPRLLVRSIALRIALAMVPGVAAVVSVFGLGTALREAQLLEREMQRDANAVAISVAQLLEARAPASAAEAGEMVAEIDQRLDHLRITVTDEPEPRAPTRAVVAIVPVEGAELSVIVAEPVSQRDAFLRRAVIADLVGVAVATLLACAFALAVGRSVVQRRVDLLIARLADVGRGHHPDEPLALGSDELGVLGQAVDDMSRQLRAAREEAAAELAARRRAQLLLRRADRLAAVGRTVSVFAHEIGTPLGVIVGRADRLLRPQYGEDVHHHAAIIRQQGDRIATFVRKLLDHARHDEAFDLARVDLGGVVRHAAGLLEDRARVAQVNIDLQLADRIEVEGDPGTLEQVVANLLTNAIDASPAEATVGVRLGIERCEAGGGRQLPPDHVHLVVEDAGEGIPEELRERVFDPFFTTKPAGEGTGLGLPIVAEIVQDHGGVVTMETSPWGGCRFVVHLPAVGVPSG